MDVAIIGAGYVGLTTSACLAELGHSVCCLDIDEARVASLQSGLVPIHEPGLPELNARHLASRRLRFSTSLPSEIGRADLVFLAVGTPSLEDGDIDLSQVEAAAKAAAPYLRSDAVLVIKSTVVPGTADRIAALVARIRRTQPVPVASNPEFLREGSAIGDFLKADRVVIGTRDRRAERQLRSLYGPLLARGVPLLTTTPTNAEAIKYAANALLALKIGFINDVADLCEAVGGDVEAVARGIGLDRRIGPGFLSVGPGFGGSCFPKDTRAFAAIGRRHGRPQRLVETLIAANGARRSELARRVLAECPRQGTGRVAILGTAFKAGTDDMREAVALDLVPALHGAGVEIVAHDPAAQRVGRDLLPDVKWADTPYAAALGADVVVILTEWPEYRSLDLSRLALEMTGATLVDFRNLFEPAEVVQHRLRYVSLGRPAANPRASEGAGSSSALGGWEQVAASPA